MSIQIGPVTLTNPVVLAPMSGVTDLPFRRLVKRYGAGLVVSEMIASQAMVRHTRQSLKIATNCAEEFPMAVQLAGHDPAIMAEAARLNADRGAAIIDINFGCPVKKIVNKAAGSALMRDERHAAKILAATVKAVDLPVTLKMRTGWDEDCRNAPALARIAEDCGVKAISVHGRTRCQLYGGQADWRFIGEVKAATRLPVIANGDIRSLDDARRCLEISGADGIMIGRGCYGRPWFPHQVGVFLETGRTVPDPDPQDRLDVVLQHYDAILGHYGTHTGVRMARKHLAWYSSGLPGSAEFRAAINRMDDPAAVKSALMDVYRPAIAREAA